MPKDNLIERLREGCDIEGEGDFRLPSLLREAADEIARLKGENERLKQYIETYRAATKEGVAGILSRNQALIEEMVEGLRPFARDSWRWTSATPDSHLILGTGEATVGDFRRARTLIAKATKPDHAL
jgi:hypothetical protein